MNETTYTISLRNIIHSIISNVLTPDSIAIDATAGNGYDTLFLSDHINGSGHIYAFDIQLQAIEQTYTRLADNGKLTNTTLLHIGHQTILHTLSLLKKDIEQQCSAIIFNLGYLPSSNKQCITKPPTTLQALQQALFLLKKQGIISIHTYHGHKGGYEEYCAISEWCSSLHTEEFHIFSIEQINKHSHKETVFFIQKIS